MEEDLLKVTGIVLSSGVISDYDRRVVILTRERGKLHCFAKISRKQGSMLGSGTRPFAFGEFLIREKRTSMQLEQVTVKNYFTEVTENMEFVFLGYYLLEFADYYTRENGDEFEALKLLYQALRALSNPHLDNRLVRGVYELRMMTMNGDYEPFLFHGLTEAGRYAVEFIIATPVEKLFTFALKPEVQEALLKAIAANRHHFIEREFRSEKVLQDMEAFSPGDPA